MTEPGSSGQDDWARLVKDAHAEKKAEPLVLAPVRPKQRRSIFLPMLLAASIAALVLHLTGPLNPWPPAPTSTELVAGQLAAMDLAARAIHDYATFHGHYPARLTDVLPQVVAIEYVPSADGFELRALDNNGQPIVVRGK